MIKFWGDLPVEDMVRVIRTYRPQVVINGWGGVHSGPRPASSYREFYAQAVVQAADPNAYPQQIAEGLSPWKVTLEVRLASNIDPGTNKPLQLPAGAIQMPVQDVSPLWGESYIEMGMEGALGAPFAGHAGALQQQLFSPPGVHAR